MKVHVTVDPQYVADQCMEKSTYTDVEDDVVDGSLSTVIEAVIDQLSFRFEPDSNELASVTVLRR